MEISASDRARFECKLRRDEVTGCLLFTGACHYSGHGLFWLGIRNRGGRMHQAHRVAWFLAGNTLSIEKPCVLHDCPNGDNPLCCEPSHLWAGSRTENNEDSARKDQGSIGGRFGLPYGVRLLPYGRFRAEVKVRCKTRHLGVFDTKEEAAKVARDFKTELYRRQ